MKTLRLKPCFGGLLLVGVFFFFNSCKKEIKPAFPESDLRYWPFGNGLFINKVDQSNGGLLAVQNYYSLIKLDGINVQEKWKTNFDNGIEGLTEGKDGELFVVGIGDYFGVRYLRVSKVGINGDIIFQSPEGQKLVPQYASHHEFLIANCSDGKNGIYIIVFLDDYNGSKKRMLVHISNQDVIDMSIELNDDYMYMTSDKAGNLFLIRTAGPEGYTMQLEVAAIDMDFLNTNKVVKKLWLYHFESLEPDWKWMTYVPFKFKYSDDHLYIIKQHNTGQNDQSTGFDIIDLDPITGNELNFTTIPFDFAVNNHNNQATCHTVFTNNKIFLAMNFGNKAKLVKMDRNGLNQEFLSLSGDSGKTLITGMGITGDRLCIFGLATLGKSPTVVPFQFLKDI